MAIIRTERRKGSVYSHDNASLRSARQATEEKVAGAGFDRVCTAVERGWRASRSAGTRARGRVAFDQIFWFLAHRIAHPSVLIIAKPDLGQSTLYSRSRCGWPAPARPCSSAATPNPTMSP